MNLNSAGIAGQSGFAPAAAGFLSWGDLGLYPLEVEIEMVSVKCHVLTFLIQ